MVKGGRVPLEIGAVIGREFDLTLLVTASEVGTDDVLDALELAEQARLVHTVPARPGRYGFAHALIRAALYDDLATSRRLRLHRQIGTALQSRSDSEGLPELAHHYCAAVPLGDTDKAVDYARRAGDQAATDLAFEEAADLRPRPVGRVCRG